MKTFTAYYRVSTQKQGASALGLEAQQYSVNAFIYGKGILVAEFTEVESGKKDNRPELAKAIAHAKATNSTLVIAKLDRLSRNAGFIFALRDSGVDFIAADLPEANTLTIGIFAVMAQHEREMISKRTKDALAAKKAQGYSLGTPSNLTNEGRLNSLKTRQNNALEDKANVQATELVTMYHEKGMKLQQIADKLNEKGFTTRRGKAFVPTTVKRLLDRHQEQQKKALDKKRYDKYFQEKMQSESGYKPASLKENPDLSPEKIQLELEDGVAYISKKSGWVLSQF
ncbi:recombinase family protein [Rufibacter sp. H-1]|uniref:Recombinase family protein n=1 Tax=Rufibacter sediminis TaxID=2762756 RepID=A0ABR6VSI7_9BACT|nr:recombinase family protein [Rufibacter sediminis]MBC3539813.1 recombinase family protein [Rufibacter sediminis]